MPFEQRRDGVAERRLAPMSDMQRPRRIRRDEFHDDALAYVRVATPEAIAKLEHAWHDRLSLGGRQTKIDEPGTCRFDGGHDIAQHGGARCGESFGELPRILPCLFREVQRFGRGEIAMIGIVRAFERRRGVRNVGQFLADRVLQRLFYFFSCIDIHLNVYPR